MTVDKIKIKSFQSIDKGEVELGSFTVFTGPSSSGKSAFIRASQALVRNSFNPSQVRMGSSFCEVTMFVDGHEIAAQRGASKSTYILDGEEFTKAGRTVPEEIQEVFSLPQIMEVESSFATQFDKPYLIADPGSVAAKVLGSLTNVSILHGGLRETNRRALEMRSKIKVRQADRDKLHEDLKQFTDLDVSLKAIEETQDGYQELQALRDKAVRVDSSVTALTHLGGQLLDIMKTKVDLSPAEITLASLQEVEARAVPLSALLQALEGASKRLPDWDYTSVPTEGFDALEGLTRLQELDQLIRTVTAGAALLKTKMDSYREYAAQISHLEEEYDNLLKDVDVCPLCNSRIGE